MESIENNNNNNNNNNIEDANKVKECTIENAHYDNPEHTTFTANVTIEGITYPFTYLCSGEDDETSDYTRAVAKRFKENSIEIAEYIEPVIQDDILAANARSKRDDLLNESDYFIQPDYPASEDDKSKVRKYRQDLRDVPSQKEFPTNIVWPEKPTCLK